jgi:hypothetical protein
VGLLAILFAHPLARGGDGHRRSPPGATVGIIVGSSSHATHRIVGSVAVGVARHSPVPLIIVP